MGGGGGAVIIEVKIYLFYFSVPIIAVGLLFFCGHQQIVHEIDPSFHLGDTQVTAC